MVIFSHPLFFIIASCIIGNLLYQYFKPEAPSKHKFFVFLALGLSFTYTSIISVLFTNGLGSDHYDWWDAFVIFGALSLLSYVVYRLVMLTKPAWRQWLSIFMVCILGYFCIWEGGLYYRAITYVPECLNGRLQDKGGSDYWRSLISVDPLTVCDVSR